MKLLASYRIIYESERIIYKSLLTIIKSFDNRNVNCNDSGVCSKDLKSHMLSFTTTFYIYRHLSAYYITVSVWKASLVVGDACPTVVCLIPAGNQPPSTMNTEKGKELALVYLTREAALEDEVRRYAELSHKVDGSQLKNK